MFQSPEDEKIIMGVVDSINANRSEGFIDDERWFSIWDNQGVSITIDKSNLMYFITRDEQNLNGFTTIAMLGNGNVTTTELATLHAIVKSRKESIS